MEPTTTTQRLTPSAHLICPQCDGPVQTTWTDQTMTWGSGDLASNIPVSVPLRTCNACDLQYLDEHGERLRHEAICRHLGVLSPAEIQSIRKGYGMSRASFANVTGLGEATISRWENSLVIQNLANDRYLRLAATPHVMRILRRMSMAASSASQPTEAYRNQFRCLQPTNAHRCAQRHFQLRRAS